MSAPKNYMAACLALLSTATLSFIDNFVIVVADHAGLWQFQIARAIMAIPLLIIGAKLIGLQLRPKRPIKLAVRSFVVAIGLMIYFAALGTLSVAQAGAGLFSAPIWIALLGIVLFGQRLNIWQLACVMVGFAGALLILQPDWADLTFWSLFPIVAGFFYGLGMMLTRYWCADENPASLAIGVFAALGLTSIPMLVAMTALSDPSEVAFLLRPATFPTATFLWLTLFQAVGALFAVSLIAEAYRTGTPEFVAIFEYSFLIFAGLWGWMLHSTILGPASWGGVAIIIISGVAMTWLTHSDTYFLRKEGSHHDA
ncbi:DMT family transporter [Lentibacter algarum]|uniref:DMT family transporter n=1 Tax=Lentibacter algarum TaxID=576131 RepID=UPI001C07094A|nr:DMT family transporter [Lentibacter algarum]MBU2980217.1 DMT family transporter [Lentibacter algarum]